MDILIHAFLGDTLLLLHSWEDWWESLSLSIGGSWVDIWSWWECFWSGSVGSEWDLLSLPVQGLGVWVSEPVNVLINALLGNILSSSLSISGSWVNIWGCWEGLWSRSVSGEWNLLSFPVKSLSIWVSEPVDIFIDAFLTDVNLLNKLFRSWGLVEVELVALHGDVLTEIFVSVHASSKVGVGLWSLNECL
jgi:hypothetical protein